jgi:spermidine/putrescine transport system permease protein
MSTLEARERRSPWVLLSPALTAIALLLIVPLAFVLVYSFWLRSASGADQAGFNLDNWRAALTDPFYRYILLNTLKISAITTALCALSGYPVAYFVARSKTDYKVLLLMLLILPFWISYIIRTMSWINILGASGALNSMLLASGAIAEPLSLLYNETTVILGLVHFLLPFMILNVFVSVEGIDETLEDAANSLGATRWQAFREVTLPLSAPGLAAGSLLCFVLAAGTYITPLVLGGPREAMFANLVYEAIITQINWPLGSALSLLLLVVLGVVVAVYNRFVGMGQIAKGLS